MFEDVVAVHIPRILALYNFNPFKSKYSTLIEISQFISSSVLYDENIFLGLLKPFQPNVAFHMQTSHLICGPNQMNGFYMKYNADLKWVNLGIPFLIQ